MQDHDVVANQLAEDGVATFVTGYGTAHDHLPAPGAPSILEVLRSDGVARPAVRLTSHPSNQLSVGYAT